jgi:hypothetical protein
MLLLLLLLHQMAQLVPSHHSLVICLACCFMRHR